MTIQQISKKINLNEATVRKRLKKLNLFVNVPGFIYSVETVLSVSYRKHFFIKRPYIPSKNSHNKLKVLELYLTNPDNRVNTIAKSLNFTYNFCDKAINEYLTNNKTITVESKINFDDEKKK